jgi:TatA/E family protein of Tat protein translocase
MTPNLAFVNGLGIGPMEMGLIFIVFLMLFGAKKLPDVARQMGRMMEDLRRASTDFKRQLHEAGDPLKEIQREVNSEVSQISMDHTVAGPAPTASSSSGSAYLESSAMDYDGLVPPEPSATPAPAPDASAAAPAANPATPEAAKD